MNAEPSSRWQTSANPYWQPPPDPLSYQSAPTLDLRYHHPALRWERLGIVIWWALFLIAAGWTWFCWTMLQNQHATLLQWGRPGLPFWTTETIVVNTIVWLPGVLPFVGWTIFRWIITGRWFLRP